MRRIILALLGILAVIATFLGTPATTVTAVAPESTSFTVEADQPAERGSLVLNPGKKTHFGEIEASTSFDATYDEVEKTYPGLLAWGGAPQGSPVDDGNWWVLTTQKPNEAQSALLASYDGPLTVLYGDAPAPQAMRGFADDLRHVLIDAKGPLQMEAYGFSDDFSALEIEYSAPPGLSVAAVKQAAIPAVAQAARSGKTPFDVDFIKSTEQVVGEADIKGGYGLFAGSESCTSGFTAVRNGNLGLVTAKHCANNLEYRAIAGTLAFGAGASDSEDGEIDLQFHQTTNNHTTTKQFQRQTSVDQTVTSVNPVSTGDVGQLRCLFGAVSGFDCSRIDQVGYCQNIVWPSTGVAHWTCGLTRVEDDISAPGDSGGPWYNANSPGTAIGIHTGGGAKSILTNVGRVESNLNATVRQN